MHESIKYQDLKYINSTNTKEKHSIPCPCPSPIEVVDYSPKWPSCSCCTGNFFFNQKHSLDIKQIIIHLLHFSPCILHTWLGLDLGVVIAVAVELSTVGIVSDWPWNDLRTIQLLGFQICVNQ